MFTLNFLNVFLNFSFVFSSNFLISLVFFSFVDRRTYHLADVEARSETFTLSIMMLQEASLTFGILLDWPQLLLDIWAWISSIFNVNIAFSGPECLGDGSGGYASRWVTNAMAPLAIILFHVIHNHTSLGETD